MSHNVVDLYEPINTLKPVDEDIWIVDGPIVRMAMYGTSIPFPTRMTIVRLNSGELWCHSPIELTKELKAEGRWYQDNGMAELHRAFRWLE